MGPVSPSAEMSSRGSQTMYNALGRLQSLGQDQTTKQMVMQQHQETGARAAEQIRQRYYKEEFKQIRDMRVQPELNRLNDHNGMLKTKLQAQVRTVPRIVRPEEVQGRMEQMGHGQTQINTVPGAPGGADGKPGAPQVIPQQIAAPNPSVTPEGLGAIESAEVLSYMGDDGRAIAVASTEGEAWRIAALSAYGEVNTSVQQNLMSIMAEYSGNPFAAQYADGLMEGVIKQSSQAVAGTNDANEAQKRLDEHAQRVAETEGQETLNDQREMEIDAERGKQDSMVARAHESISRGQIPQGIGEALAEKIRNGEELTPREAATVAQALKTNLENDLRAKSNTQGVQHINKDNVEFYIEDLNVRDDKFKMEYNVNMDAEVATAHRSFLKGTQEEQAQWFASRGIPQAEINLFTTDNIAGKEMQAAFKMDAEGKGARERAQGAALVSRLPSLEHEDLSGRTTRQVDRVLDEREAELRLQNAQRSRPYSENYVNQMIDSMRQYRSHTFTKQIHGYAPEPAGFIEPVKEYAAGPLSQQQAPGAQQAPGVEAPATEQAPPKYRGRLIPGTDTPDTRGVTELTEYERVHGRGAVNPVKAIGRGIASAARGVANLFPDKMPNEQNSPNIPYVNMQDRVTGPDGRQTFVNSTYASLDSTMLKTLLEQPSLAPETRAEIEMALSNRLPTTDSFDRDRAEELAKPSPWPSLTEPGVFKQSSLLEEEELADYEPERRDPPAGPWEPLLEPGARRPAPEPLPWVDGPGPAGPWVDGSDVNVSKEIKKLRKEQKAKYRASRRRR